MSRETDCPVHSWFVLSSKGAVRAAADQAGESLTSTITGTVHDCARRRDVAAKQIVLPDRIADCLDMTWAHHRPLLWNAVERLEQDASIHAREWFLGLPPRFTPHMARGRVLAFACWLANRYQAAVDVGLHVPRVSGPPDTPHAHLLMTLREVTRMGFGAPTVLELSTNERREQGIWGTATEERRAIRRQWRQLMGAAT